MGQWGSARAHVCRVASRSAWAPTPAAAPVCEIQQRVLGREVMTPSTHGLFDIHFSSKIYFEVINPHTVGSLTILRASIKLV